MIEGTHHESSLTKMIKVEVFTGSLLYFGIEIGGMSVKYFDDGRTQFVGIEIEKLGERR